MAEILVVEDDATLAFSVQTRLGLAGHRVRCVPTLALAREAVAVIDSDLIVLDLGLPDGDGLTLCSELRTSGARVPILILTARGTIEARIDGLRGGADDYLTKPFDLDELVARVEALLRRTGWRQAAEHLHVGRLDVDVRAHTATVAGEPVQLTALELRLLRYLASRAGAAVSRGELLVEVWGVADGVKTRTVDVFISRLRKLIEEDASEPRFLVSVRGVGYRLELTPSDGE